MPPAPQRYENSLDLIDNWKSISININPYQSMQLYNGSFKSPAISAAEKLQGLVLTMQDLAVAHAYG